MKRHTLLAGAMLCLAACGRPDATVTYSFDPNEDFEGLTKFQISKTALLIDYADAKEGKDTTKIKITAVPQEDDQVFALRAADSWLSKTNFSHVKIKGTNIFQSVSTNVEDRRIELIQQGGGIVTGLFSLATSFGLLSAGQAKPVLPYAVDLTNYMSCNAPAGCTITEVPLKPMRIIIEKAPNDAVPRKTFMESLAKNPRRNILFYSACRDARVFYEGQNFSFKVSDPASIQTIAMPQKGKVEFDPSCGVNVTEEKSEVASDAKIVKELISQTKSLLDAKKK